jgi:prepilin-type N-terminal cleavage/methylation domain-containing protein
MWRSKRTRAGFALYEVLIGLAIFAVGVLALGRSVQNCLNASGLSAEEDRVRQILADRMAEVQATPGFPDAKKETKVATGYGNVLLLQRSVQTDLKDDDNAVIGGLHLVTLSAEWKRNGVAQSRRIQFYVYRQG